MYVLIHMDANIYRILLNAYRGCLYRLLTIYGKHEYRFDLDAPGLPVIEMLSLIIYRSIECGIEDAENLITCIITKYCYINFYNRMIILLFVVKCT